MSIVASTDLFEFPATPTQQSLWFLHRLEPHSSAYNIPLAFRLRGELNAAALRQAFEALVARHEILRTTFLERDGQLLQCVQADRPLDWQCTELPAGTVANADCGPRAAALAAQRFDLQAGPLLRVRLIRYGATDALLVVVLHHIVVDHLSLGLCAADLQRAYREARAGRPAALPEPPLQFADYSVWLQQHAAADGLPRKLAVWQRRLAGCSGVLALPTDRPRPALQTSAGAQHRLALDPALSAQAQQFARREGVSLFVVLLGALKVLLHRYSGQDDVIVGTPFANRSDQEDLEAVVGCFINTLPIASRFDADTCFLSLLAALKSAMLEAFEAQDVPLEAIVDAVKPQRDPGRNPLFQVGFVLQAPPVALALDGLAIEDLRVHSGGAMYDLHFWLWEGPQQVEGMLWFNTDLYDEASVQHLVADYQHLLGQMLAQPEALCSALPLCSAEDRAQLSRWNGEAPVLVSPAASVVELLLTACRRHAEATALSHAGQALSYRELEARSRALAGRLQARGAGRGRRVGLCLPRGTDMVIAQWAILRCGAAYVPFDPGFPPERLKYMADDAELALIVTQRAEAQANGWADERCLLIDQTDHPVAETVMWVDVAIAPDDPAYLIYTSGSTGRPKGVLVPHRAVVNFLASMAGAPGLSEADRLLAVTTLSFDIAVLELMLPLTVGAEVVLASRADTQDGHALRALLESSGATVMQATPGTWRLLLDAGWAGGPSFKALVGGEALTPDLAAALLERCGALWNLYGPTETTVWSTCWPVQPDERGIAIGRPIANTQVHVLDERLQPCPIGVPGEICIGGDGVALGYWRRPELTAERFVADPFSGRPGARLYRTGDRGRWRHDGQLQHLGRLDQQVKLRGYRIEPGEIEAALVAHPQLREAVVVVREDRPGDPRLVAYTVAADERPPANALRDHLRHTLPDYMLPQQIVALDAIPRLPNGKIDRRALPPPPSDEADGRAAGLIAPRSPAEQAVAEVWCEILGIKTIGVDDNFFDLGGHSLLAMRAVTAMEQRLGVRINLRRMIFESLAQLAATDADDAAAEATDATTRRPGLFGRLAGALRPALAKAGRAA